MIAVLPENLEQQIWHELSKAITERDHAFRWATLGYVNSDQAPILKTVVLRRVDLESRKLSFFTDYRSAKITALAASGATATLLFLDHRTDTQATIIGSPIVHSPSSETAKHFYDALSTRQHLDYATIAAPGTMTANPEQGNVRASRQAASHFAVVDVSADSIDAVKLARPTLRLKGRYHRPEAESGACFNGGWAVP